MASPCHPCYSIPHIANNIIPSYNILTIWNLSTSCKIASRYRIAFAVPERYRAAYPALGYPNPAKTGSKGWMLPIPATYVLDSTGLVVLSYLDADYTTRLEPTEIIVALTHLRAASIPARNNR